MGLRNGGERRSRGKRRATKPKAISTTWILRLALGVVAALIVFGGTVQIQRRVNVRRLRRCPISSQPKAVSEHLLARFDAARADPRSDQAVGALCVAYHADMFHDQADRCYALASALNPDEWRWKYYQALIHSERGEGDVVAAAMREVTGKADFGPAWWRLGEAEFKEGRYDRAEEAWRRALKAPEPQRTGSATTSAEAFGRIAFASSRHSPPAHASLGLARLALARGNADDARQILERVTTTSPRFSSGFRLLAESYTVPVDGPMPTQLCVVPIAYRRTRRMRIRWSMPLPENRGMERSCCGKPRKPTLPIAPSGASTSHGVLSSSIQTTRMSSPSSAEFCARSDAPRRRWRCFRGISKWCRETSWRWRRSAAA